MEAEGMKKEITEHDERKKLEHLDLKSDVWHNSKRFLHVNDICERKTGD